VVLGGLILSTVFTILVVPALFSLVMDWKRKRDPALSEEVMVPEIHET